MSSLSDELKLLDDIDVVILLSIGDLKLTHKRLQMIAFLVSEMLKIKHDFVFVNGVPFSETIYEKVYTGFLSDYVSRGKGRIFLTDRGLRVYEELVRVMLEKGLDDVVKAIEVVRGMGKELLNLIHFLYPDMVLNSASV